MAEKKYIPEGKLIDGNQVAAQVQESVAAQVRVFKQQTGTVPGLTVILVGDDGASKTYVGKKAEAATAVGIASDTINLPADTSQAALLEKIDQLNADPSVHGILVQLPLPGDKDKSREKEVIARIDPRKDVDGFHVVNSGLLATGQQDQAVVACTPQGCMTLLETVHGKDLSGLTAVVIGRSNIVGRPMMQLLEQANATVINIHSRTGKEKARSYMQMADILVPAVGVRGMVTAEDVKPGATIIDVGINTVYEAQDGSWVDIKPGVDVPAGAKVLVRGDVDNSAAEVAGYITPVPGGVGPMTVATLMANTLKAACLQHHISQLAE